MSILQYPMLVSDIDGTLVNRTKKIPAENKQTLFTFRRQGGLFTLATGRSYPEAKRFIKEMDVQLPVILCNGGILFDPATNVLKPTATIDRIIVLDTLADLEKLTGILDIFVYTLDKVYGKDISPLSQSAIEEGEFPLELIQSFHRLPKTPWIKIVIVAKEDAAPHLQHWAQNMDYPLELVQSSQYYYELLPLNVSKGNAVRKLAERYDLDVGQCAAIGDHLNDLSMIQVTGASAAVANAHPTLMQAAQQIVPSNDEAGVAHFIRNHLLSTVSYVQGS
ncbi:HAD family hydrolase [Melghirimyces algeriensis]|uniref:Cof subfamily of IIB subfamily of haloacid dehalogenase superfamily/HAD-superfamily hydrolase, subfamily IIB n=1 Tax=Melghirimyces algeriensis TaxID=910412 RepID=A0A521FBU1_9BACL|nr:HAD family hydrolase [Melghirimyces algeriensis]SMO93071.1 hypothetical protein SAMN06264849_11542 [Melghirimyces algeriensis]